MPRRSPHGHRRAFTLLELLVVLVLLGVSAGVVLPAFRLPPPASPEAPIVRARALAVRRGEAVRLSTRPDGRWQVAAAADTAGAILLTGTGVVSDAPAGPRTVVISPLGSCLPEGPSARNAEVWDPVRCAPSPR